MQHLPGLRCCCLGTVHIVICESGQASEAGAAARPPGSRSCSRRACRSGCCRRRDQAQDRPSSCIVKSHLRFSRRFTIARRQRNSPKPPKSPLPLTAPNCPVGKNLGAFRGADCRPKTDLVLLRARLLSLAVAARDFFGGRGWFCVVVNGALHQSAGCRLAGAASAGGCRWDRAAASLRCGLGSGWRARARLGASPVWAWPVSAVLHRRGGLFFSVREGARLCANLAVLWLDIGGGSGALRGRYADGAKRRFVGLVSRRLVVKCGAAVICASAV